MENQFEWALKNINKDIITQGNLDPALLSSNNFTAIKNEVYRILEITRKKMPYFQCRSWFNSEVKIDNIKYVIKLIDNYR